MILRQDTKTPAYNRIFRIQTEEQFPVNITIQAASVSPDLVEYFIFTPIDAMKGVNP